jgi:hypothetical protein
MNLSVDRPSSLKFRRISTWYGLSILMILSRIYTIRKFKYWISISPSLDPERNRAVSSGDPATKLRRRAPNTHAKKGGLGPPLSAASGGGDVRCLMPARTRSRKRRWRWTRLPHRSSHGRAHRRRRRWRHPGAAALNARELFPVQLLGDGIARARLMRHRAMHHTVHGAVANHPMMHLPAGRRRFHCARRSGRRRSRHSRGRCGAH